MEEQWDRLGRAVEARRLSAALDYATQEQLATKVGISRRTLTTLESGGRIRRSTLLLIESALGWAKGSADAVLNGGEPTLLASPEPTFADPDEAALWALSNLPTSTRLSLIDHLRAERHRQTG